MESPESAPQLRITHVPLEEQRKRVLDIMRESGIEVEESNTDTFPHVVNKEGLEGLSDLGERCFAKLEEEARLFWAGLIIKDHFEMDEDARQRFQDKMNAFPLYKELDNRNKLRVNVHTNLHGAFRVLVADLDRQNIRTPQADTIRDIYASLFPIPDVGFFNEAGQRGAKKVRERFPTLPPIDDRPDVVDDHGRPVRWEPSYRFYYLHLNEEQRLQIVANFDKAAHDFLELITRPSIEALAEKGNT